MERFEWRPPKISSLNPWYLPNVTFYAKGLANVIKVLRWGDYPELSRWAMRAITNVLIREAEDIGTHIQKERLCHDARAME